MHDGQQLHEFLSRMEALKADDPNLYFAIENQLTMLYKYRVVRALHTQKFNALKASDRSLTLFDNDELLLHLTRAQLLDLQEWSCAIKHWVYPQVVSLLAEEHRDKLSSVLSSQALTALLHTRTTVEMLPLLHRATLVFNEELAARDKHVAGSINAKYTELTWYAWCVESAYYIRECGYQFSLLGLGLQLGDAIDEKGFGRYVGGGVGLLLTYWLGTANFIKTLLMGLLSIVLIKSIRTAQVDDEKAVINNYFYHVQPKTVPRVLNIVSSTLESFYSQNPFILIQSLITELGNTAVFKAIAQCKPHWLALADPNQTINTIISHITIFLLSAQLGAMLTKLLENGYSSYTINKDFAQEIRGNSGDHIVKESISVEPAKWSSASFWFTRRQAVRVVWQVQNNSAFFVTQCELLQADPTSRQVAVNCESPLTQFLALPR